MDSVTFSASSQQGDEHVIHNWPRRLLPLQQPSEKGENTLPGRQTVFSKARLPSAPVAPSSGSHSHENRYHR
jgi:hypothetical protein